MTPDNDANTITATPPPRRDRLTRLTESLQQEHSFLTIPLNRYKNLILAEQRFVYNEINAVISAVNDADDVQDNEELTKDDALELLGSLVSRLASLKEEFKDRSFKERLQTLNFETRLTHIDSADLVTFPHWKTLRMSRILVDYLLRMSYRDTASMLAGITDTLRFSDREEFDEAKTVISALLNKDAAPALAWCADNEYELKNSKSKLELELRLQEFIELVRAENNSQALTYARKYIAPWGSKHMEEVMRVIATLAFRNTTQFARYKVLFEEKQWDNLVGQFKHEFFKLYGMTSEPLLYIYLQAGLCALKTPFCFKDDCNKRDPLSQESLRKLALDLPFRMQYREPNIVCYITGEKLGPGNQPVILPNGYVYSYQACKYMMDRNDGKIICPRTGAVCRWEEALMFYD